MSDKQTFSSLRVWQTAHELAVKMYQLAQELPKEEQYSMANQLKRSASAVAGHLAEGYGRYYYRDKERSFNNAKAAIAEVQNFLYLAKDLHFLDEDKTTNLVDEYERLSRGVGALASKVSKSRKKSENIVQAVTTAM